MVIRPLGSLESPKCCPPSTEKSTPVWLPGRGDAVPGVERHADRRIAVEARAGGAGGGEDDRKQKHREPQTDDHPPHGWHSIPRFPAVSRAIFRGRTGGSTPRVATALARAYLTGWRGGPSALASPRADRMGDVAMTRPGASSNGRQMAVPVLVTLVVAAFVAWPATAAPAQDLQSQLSQKRADLQQARTRQAALSGALERYSHEIDQLSAQVTTLRAREAR